MSVWTINIEIDEFEHGQDNPFYDFHDTGQYTPPCEVKRMYEIAVEDGGTYLQIRFNTDVERDANGKPITKIAGKRLKILTDVIERYLKMEDPPQFMVIFMFYSKARYRELHEQFIHGTPGDLWKGLGQDFAQFLHLVSYNCELSFM